MDPLKYSIYIFLVKIHDQFENMFAKISYSVGRCVIPWESLGKSVKHLFSCRKMYFI